MHQIITGILLAFLVATSVTAGEGILSVKSAHSVSDTADRLEAILGAKGMSVFARVDHAAGAQKAGKSLPPTQLLIFGNPKVGTPLMLCSPSIAIDLPQKALIWQDADGVTWISYNDPQFLKLRHNTQGCDAVLQKVSMALGNFTSKAGSAE
ncbi:MAG: DUF302 domain-containing protein [Gammaproteobacteria bacterium]|nr:DUF302 domain-containing protein [Gammaproteobacteria bacterium]